ncbi:MAG TPA: tripartite tricarboxylate transporter TctB family protein [Nitrospinota bacterium]|nr:tripartite tricarboxylate transporter TctB family protein [Nitrospinota bacterium]
MKKGEIYMAVFWAVLSIAIMLESGVIPATRQSIAWEKGVGPASGWFPFYLAGLMLICSLIVLIPKVIDAVKEGLADKPFVTLEALKEVLWGFWPMFAFVFTIPWLGFYLGATIYIIYYMRAVGRHSWKLSLPTGILFNVAVFYIFEKSLKLTLEKGITESLLFKLL